MLKDLAFAGAAVLITGGGSGIGRAAAETLAELGATVAIAGRRAQPLAETAALIAAKGGRCHSFVADVSDEAQVAALARAVTTRLGGLKALVNNAGNNFRAKLADLPTEKWREIVGVDLDSVFFMCRAFIPTLLAAKQPSILNIASTFGVIGNAEMPAYSAAKGAVINFTRQLAVDYGAQGLRVNTLCPGPTLSPRLKGYLDKGLTDRARLERGVMLNRLAECREIANVAAFLVSDAASFVHGATILADGGQTIH